MQQAKIMQVAQAQLANIYNKGKIMGSTTDNKAPQSVVDANKQRDVEEALAAQEKLDAAAKNKSVQETALQSMQRSVRGVNAANKTTLG